MAETVGRQQTMINALLERGNADDIKLAMGLQRMNRQQYRTWLRGQVKAGSVGQGLRPARRIFKGITTRNEAYHILNTVPRPE